MTHDIQLENKKLHRQLKAFVAQARENESKLQRFNEQELELIGATSMSGLIELILKQYPQTFRLDSICLTLLDPEYEIVRMLESAGVTLSSVPGLVIEPDMHTLERLYDYPPRPLLGSFRPQEHGNLFTGNTSALRSRAFLPLLRRGELIGSLNMGSSHPGRFIEGSGTEFLERLAAIVAICLENCANHQRIKQLGLTDPLTRVNNRRYFDQRLGEEVARAERTRQPLGCMFLDVDHFKRVNDEHGHQSGDQVLQEIAMIISSQLRHSDILCRYGGEEFVVLLPDTSADKCIDIAERIRHAVEMHPFRLNDTETLSLTLSIGLSSLSPSSQQADSASQAADLISSADQAVYQAKEQGRNRVRQHTMSE